MENNRSRLLDNKGKTSNFSGITLIALVITVIVLLILAGISISMLSGENGILQRATDAKTETERMEKFGYKNKKERIWIKKYWFFEHFML